MGILDGILGNLLGGHSNASPLQSILGSVLGGGQQQQGGIGGALGGLLGGGQQQQQGGLGGALGGLLGGGQQQSGGMGGMLGGGLGGLLNRFQQNGMGDVAQSWVGTGPNRPVSPDQLNQVFGDEQVNQWSQQSNIPKHDLLSQLSQYLPSAVDQMTPGGQVPADPVEGSPFDGPGVDPRSGRG